MFDLTSRPAASPGDPSSAPFSQARLDRAAYEHVVDQACLAEDGGLDAYYLTEHHFNPGFHIVPSPHLLVAALSQRTTRIRLGVMCTNLTLHHPVRVAEEIRMMDLLTGGRLEVGFGRGAAAHEQVGYGVDPAVAEPLFDHSMAVIGDLLTTGQADSYEVGPWKGGKVVLVPAPTQQPHPPLWLAAVADQSLRKAARLGLNLCTAFLDMDDVTRTSRTYREAWQEWHADRPCGRYGTLQQVFVGESERDLRHSAGSLNGWVTAGLSLEEASAKGRIVYGTPDTCIAQLLRMASSGVDMFQGWFQFGVLDQEASTRSLKLFCDAVVPGVRVALGLGAGPALPLPDGGPGRSRAHFARTRDRARRSL